MSESFELFVHQRSIIKLDCFEFLPENAWSLEVVGGYVHVSHPSLKLIFLMNECKYNELPVCMQKMVFVKSQACSAQL